MEVTPLRTGVGVRLRENHGTRPDGQTWKRRDTGTEPVSPRSRSRAEKRHTSRSQSETDLPNSHSS
jgi:hypothetical protein